MSRILEMVASFEGDLWRLAEFSVGALDKQLKSPSLASPIFG
jgi:hypothetical protein